MEFKPPRRMVYRFDPDSGHQSCLNFDGEALPCKQAEGGSSPSSSTTYIGVIMIRIGYILLTISWILLGGYWCDIDFFERNANNFPILLLGSIAALFIFGYPYKLPGEK